MSMLGFLAGAAEGASGAIDDIYKVQMERLEQIQRDQEWWKRYDIKRQDELADYDMKREDSLEDYEMKREDKAEDLTEQRSYDESLRQTKRTDGIEDYRTKKEIDDEFKTVSASDIVVKEEKDKMGNSTGRFVRINKATGVSEVIGGDSSKDMMDLEKAARKQAEADAKDRAGTFTSDSGFLPWDDEGGDFGGSRQDWIDQRTQEYMNRWNGTTSYGQGVNKAENANQKSISEVISAIPDRVKKQQAIAEFKQIQEGYNSGDLTQKETAAAVEALRKKYE